MLSRLHAWAAACAAVVGIHPGVQRCSVHQLEDSADGPTAPPVLVVLLKVCLSQTFYYLRCETLQRFAHELSAAHAKLVRFVFQNPNSAIQEGLLWMCEVLREPLKEYEMLAGTDFSCYKWCGAGGGRAGDSGGGDAGAGAADISAGAIPAAQLELRV